MAGFHVCQDGHVVNAVPPLDINGTGFTSDRFKLALYSHASFLLQIGANNGASVITVEECDAESGGTTRPIGFKYAKEETALGDTLSALANASSTGISTHASEDNILYLLEIDASELSNGFPYVCVKGSDPSASVLVSGVAILSGARYAGEITPTAVT